MPNFDGTGPTGKGPKTGRGLGKCKGATEDKSSPLNLRRGSGRRPRRGRNA